jgi:hypothetical protein
MLEANYGTVATAAYNALFSAGIKQKDELGQISDVAPPSDFSGWLNDRRTYIDAQVQTLNAPFAITTGTGTAITIPASQTQLTLAGTAPVEVATIQASGANATAGAITWTSSITTWNLPLTLVQGTSPITVTVRGYDRFGQLLQPSGTYTKTFTITRQ